jgi:uncharacterized protein
MESAMSDGLSPPYNVPMSASANDRIEVVDVLRAFALFGIMVTHSGMEFLVGPPPYENFGRVHSFDPVVQQVVSLLTTGKFFMIFSFLFGLSFAIQIDNAARKGKAFAGRFSWRLTVLFLIGCVHSVFFSGDILVIYALLGFLLLPLRNVRTRVLLWISAVLVLNIPMLLLGLVFVNAAPSPGPEQQQAAAAASQQFAEMAQRFFEIKSSGTLSELAAINTSTMFVMKLLYMFGTGRFWITFACFLLGMCAGRVGLFLDTPANRATMRRILVVGGAVAAIGTILVLLFPANPLGPRSTRDVFAGFASSVQNASLAAFLIATVSLLYWRAPDRGPLPALSPMGRMGLTTYLMQTVFGLIVFYGIGFGLMGKLGAGLGVLVGFLFCVAQVFFSRAWLSRFTMGPAEWLWRTLTYFKLLPISRRGPATA